jgi:3-hydroxyisobutyrate dehydrogenase
MGALARNLFNLHASQGQENKDFSSILELYRQDSARLRAAI